MNNKVLPKKEFALHCKRMFMTYKKCSLLVSKQQVQHEVLKMFKDKKAKITTLITAYESSDSENCYEHFHVYIELDRKIKISSSRFLDINGIHGEYQAVRDPSSTIHYVMKDHDYMIHGYTMSLQPICKSSQEQIVLFIVKKIYIYKTWKRYAKLMVLNKQQLLTKAVLALNDQDRARYYLHQNFIQLSVFKFLEDKYPSLFARKETLSSFYFPSEILQWLKSHKHSLTLILTGPSGIGKTEFAKELFNNPLLISHMDQLKCLSSKHDGIIFDDIKFKNYSRESCIHLTDVSNDRGINVKNDYIVIPSQMPRVITTNSSFEQLFPPDKHKAIIRRCFVFVVVNSLYDSKK